MAIIHISTSSISKPQIYAPLYSEYEKHITEFDDKIYFSNKNMGEDSIFDDKIDNFYNFLTLYKKVEEEDAKKSTLFFSNKFKKGANVGGGGGGPGGPGSPGGPGPNSGNYNQSGYSYNLTHFQKQHNQKQPKVWNSHTPKNDDEKLNTLIESYLNKISDESYKKISIDFVNELIKMEDHFFFDVMVKKIVDKCVMDNKYQHLYIHLCNKIWTNRQIHYHLAEITEEDDGKYYWMPKYVGTGTSMGVTGAIKKGPFHTEMDAKLNLFQELNFKRYFMNYLQQLFIHKNVNFTHIENDEEFFLHKRQFMVIIEVLGILYLEKYIPVDILHLVIMQLLHMTDIGVKIEPIEIDGVLQILKIMNTYREKNGIADYFALPIFNEYYDYITHIEMHEEFNIRTKYFLTDCKEIIRGKPNGGKSKIKAPSHLQLSAAVAAAISEPSVPVEMALDKSKVAVTCTGISVDGEDGWTENYDGAMEKMKFEKKRNSIAGMITLCEKMTEEVREKVVYDVIYRYCESQCKDDIYEGFIRKFLGNLESTNLSLFQKAMDGIVGNMGEIHIDIPNVVEVMRECVGMIERLDLYPFAQIVEFNEKIQLQATLIESESGADDDEANFW